MNDTPGTTPRSALRTLALLAAFAVAPFAALAQGEGDDPVVLRVGDEERTLSQFKERFDIAMRQTAAQQGMPLSDEVRAQFEALAPQFLDQRAQQVALLDEADARGIDVSDAEIDEQVAELRGDADGATFTELLEANGFGDEATLRELLAENARILALRDELAADVDVTDAEVEEAFAANEGAEDVELEDVRGDIESVLVEQKVQARLVELVDDADVQTFPDRLPAPEAAPAPAPETAPATPQAP